MTYFTGQQMTYFTRLIFLIALVLDLNSTFTAIRYSKPGLRGQTNQQPNLT